MGVCSASMCEPDNNSYESEYSLKSALIRSVKPYEDEEWEHFIKDIILRYNFESIERQRYSRPVRETIRFSREDQGEEMETQYNRFVIMSAEQKGRELESMLSKAYMIIDEEEMPHNNSKLLLPQLASRTLFTSSMNASIIGSVQDPETVKKRNQKLRMYDPVILQALQGFVNFCKELQQQITTRESILYLIIISFKSSIVQIAQSLTQVKSNQGKVYVRNKVSACCNRFINFLVEGITLMYNIPKIQEREKEKCFYSEINLYTLVTSLIFEDQQFTDVLKKIYSFSMHKDIEKLKQNPHLYYQKYPLPIEYSLDNKTLQHMKVDKYAPQVDLQEKPLASLFKSTSISGEPYSKCVKMLSQLRVIKEPIGKLKAIYQTGLQINKQVERFYKNYYIPVPRIDGQKLLQIVRNILSRCQNNQYIIAEIIMTSDFVHNYYKMSKKGAYLTPFLAAIEESQRI